MFSKLGKALNGVSVKHHKNTADMEAVKMPVPETVTILMAQHMGPPCTPMVKLLERVTVGQMIGDSEEFLTSPIYSSVSGHVTEIVDFTTGNGGVCKGVVIATDGEQTVSDGLVPFPVNSHKDLMAATKKCGLVGLGGAGFPTHIKQNPRNIDEVDTLVVNGAECEPYITCDNRAMIDSTENFISGIELMLKHMKLSKAVIGIEENKPNAIKKLNEITASMSHISVKVLPSTYPQGAEKVLIYACTGRVVGEGKLPSDHGVVVSNVATLVKLGDFVKTGMPLVNKVVTVDGSAVTKPQNIIVPIGTKISDIVEFCGGYSQEARKILLGGPMMGMSVPSDQYPITKTTNAVLAFGEAEAVLPEESACIRCGKCVRACPFDLMPAALDSAYRTNDVDKLLALKVNLCMECGCCTYACPAKRGLAASNKLAKIMLRSLPKK